MGKNSKIAWTDHTWNPWWGCEKVSPGCAHCYAETFAKRTGHAVWGKDTPRRFFKDSHWNEPVRWNAEALEQGERRRVFCASMADVFEDRDDLVQERSKMFRLIEATPNLDWLLLTKRPQNANKLGRQLLTKDGWPKNIWLGTTVENQEQADLRVPELLDVPAQVRFLSCEPLLGPVDLTGFYMEQGQSMLWDREPGEVEVVGALGHGINLVIVGGESGPGARRMDLDWARSLRNQCLESSTSFFMKQLGGHPDKREDIRDFPADLGVRQFPELP